MRTVAFIFIVSLFSACKDKPGTTTVNSDSAANSQYFPLASFINDQLKEVDSAHVPVVKYLTSRGVTTSAITSSKELRAAAEEFVHPDITLPPLKDKYKENSFADQSIPSITLSYSPTDRSLEIQRLDVILQPDPVASDKVKSIYMEKNGNANGTLVTKKMLLRVGNNFQVITSEKDSTVTIVKFEWGIMK